MKKLSTVVAGLALAGSLAACGSSSAQDYSSTYTPPVDTSTPTPDPSPAVNTYSPPANSVTPEAAQQLGLEICADLRGGMTWSQASQIFSTVGLTTEQGAGIMAAAIQSYCPEQAP